MSGWAVFGLVLLCLFLLGQVRVGVAADYTADGPSVRIRLGAFRLKVFPRPKKEPKEERQKEPKPKKEKKRKKDKKKPDGGEDAVETEAKPSKMTVGGALDLAHEFLPLVLEAAGCFWRKLVVDKLELCLTVGGTDPADAAMLYGQANAALGAIWRPLTSAFHVKNGRAHVQVDFDAPATTIYGNAALSMKIGQILWLGLHFGWKALCGFLRFKKQQKIKEQERKAV